MVWVGQGIWKWGILNIGLEIGNSIFYTHPQSCMYRGWESHTGIIIFKVHLSLIALANIIPTREKGGKAYALGLSNLFEMYPPSIHVDLVVTLYVLGSDDTI